MSEGVFFYFLSCVFVFVFVLYFILSLTQGVASLLVAYHKRAATCLKVNFVLCVFCIFFVGGPNGIDSTIKHLAQEQLSLSKMTFSHSIVRLMVAEQIYRAWSILQGHPYHK